MAEGANAVTRIKVIRPDASFDRRVLHAFTTLFTTLDTRIAEVIDAGIKRNVYFTRMKMPRIAENSGQMVAPPRERYIPRGESDHTPIAELVRGRLRPTPEPPSPPRGAARSRAELHSAIVHRPASGATGPSLSM